MSKKKDADTKPKKAPKTFSAEDMETVEKAAEQTAEPEVSENDILKKTAAENMDKYQRTLAEFDNFRKRTEKEKSVMFDMGVTTAVLKVLPVYDNFSRALAAASDSNNQTDGFYKGVEMIFSQLVETLKSLGVTEIDAAGGQFDANFHEAVMHIEDKNFGQNEVVEELQKGFLYKDKVIRHSLVKVAN